MKNELRLSVEDFPGALDRVDKIICPPKKRKFAVNLPGLDKRAMIVNHPGSYIVTFLILQR